MILINLNKSSQIVNGVKYDGVQFKTYIYPNRLGDLAVGPVQIQSNILYKTGQEAIPFNQDNSFFGADVFNNFFDSYATRPHDIQRLNPYNCMFPASKREPSE